MRIQKLTVTVTCFIGVVVCLFLIARYVHFGNASRSQEHTERPNDQHASRYIDINHLETWDSIDNPENDGWQIEVHANTAKDLLTQLGQVLFKGQTNQVDRVTRFVSPNISFHSLLPDGGVQTLDDGVLKIEKTLRPEKDAAVKRGADLFLQSVREFSAQWQPRTKTRFEIKVVRVRQQDDEVETHQLVSSFGKSDDRCFEQHAKWVTRWRIDQPNEQWSLISFELADFEQSTYQSAEPWFSDIAPAVLAGESRTKKQLQFGMNYWLDRVQDMRYFSPLGNPGLAVADVNNDGLDDLYICQEANLPNRLLLQKSDGTVTDASSQWQVDWLESSRSALFVDLDNDGDQDLVVAILGGLVVASNEGSKFQVRDVLETDDDTTSLSSADFDNDGKLDLYVCVDYPNDDLQAPTGVAAGATNRVYHDANSAGRNHLFRNDHSKQQPWKFTDVTEEAGLNQNNRRFSWAAAWEDYDNDGDQDLYVANDFGRNCLYENREGKFTDVAATSNAEDSASGMAVAWADVDRDGLMDLHVANMFSSAGNRITHDPQFKSESPQIVRQRIQRFAKGSTLLKNRDGQQFQDVSDSAGITNGRWAWSSNFIDINNDGWEDVVVANGYITGGVTSDL